jgi:hypothetical protein
MEEALIASTVSTLTEWLKRCLSGSPMEYVEVYELRAGFVHLHDGYDTLGPFGEITSKLCNVWLGHEDGISQHELNITSR